MVALIQRVLNSSVIVDDETVGEINKGLNILLGIFKDDNKQDIEKLIYKIVHLRIFNDENNKMNLSLKDINADVLVISQFTLAGDIKKGRRPSFDKAKEPKEAKELYELFIKKLKNEATNVQSGIFGATMKVYIVNDGPVTFILDSKKLN